MGDRPTFTADDARMMDRALHLAQRGLGLVSPNPVVGCVIVDAIGDVAGEGWHQGPGTPHAEPLALRTAGDNAAGATAYVTLEPCNHHGQTPPCSLALVDAGIARVIYAMADPNLVAAGGHKTMVDAGIDVKSGLRESQAQDLNRAWCHFVLKKRPYIFGKSAMSLDGRIATAAGESKWITSPASRTHSHKLRAQVDAIIVGVNTVIADNPALTARLDDTVRTPLRVILDSSARSDPMAQVFSDTGQAALLVTTHAAAPDKLQPFKDRGVNVMQLPADENGHPELGALLDALYQLNIVSALVEGGGTVLGSFFDADLIDELTLFVAPKLIGGGATAFGGHGVSNLADASRFHFEPVDIDGPDFLFRGIRQQEAR